MADLCAPLPALEPEWVGEALVSGIVWALSVCCLSVRARTCERACAMRVQVGEALSTESREKKSVDTLKQQLMQLQREVGQAHEQLHLTQSRVEHNMRRINELRAETVRAFLDTRCSCRVSGAFTASRTMQLVRSRPCGWLRRCAVGWLRKLLLSRRQPGRTL
jgi:hypothetical protein